MNFIGLHGYRAVETSPEVYFVIQARHADQMGVFSSFSAPDGNHELGVYNGRMETTWGIRGTDYPIIGAKKEWDLEWNQNKKCNERKNEKTIYYLFCPEKEEE